jgi:uridylate kinase
MNYKRILLKLSGEVFGGKDKGINFTSIETIGTTIEKIRKNTGVQMAIVVGSGNLFRGRNVEGTKVDRIVADHIGMLGTIMNALALQEAMERMGSQTRVMSSIPINAFCEPYIRRKAIRHMEKGRIVIIGGGTGNPLCTTDFAAAQKAIELKCDIILKASNIDGVYNKDPRKYSNAYKFNDISYQYALENGLKVMDPTAFALCQEHNMPIIVFSVNNLKNIEDIIKGKKLGTLVTKSGK